MYSIFSQQSPHITAWELINEPSNLFDETKEQLETTLRLLKLSSPDMLQGLEDKGVEFISCCLKRKARKLFFRLIARQKKKLAMEASGESTSGGTTAVASGGSSGSGGSVLITRRQSVINAMNVVSALNESVGISCDVDGNSNDEDEEEGDEGDEGEGEFGEVEEVELREGEVVESDDGEEVGVDKEEEVENEDRYLEWYSPSRIERKDVGAFQNPSTSFIQNKRSQAISPTPASASFQCLNAPDRPTFEQSSSNISTNILAPVDTILPGPDPDKDSSTVCSIVHSADPDIAAPTASTIIHGADPTPIRLVELDKDSLVDSEELRSPSSA